MYRTVERLFGIDFRALAAFRVAIGLIVLVDLAVRATAFSAHYSDAGVLPRAFYFAYYPDTWALSLHLLSGSLWWQAALFVAAAITTLAYMAGYHTRVASCALWLLTLSLHTRNPLVLNGGDWLLLNLLLWSLFLPLGARWSLDALAGRHERDDGYHLSVATLGIVLQICLVYWFTVMFKSEEVWLEEATALHLALNLDYLARPAGQWLLGLPDGVLHLLSRGTYYLELYGPMMAFIPIWIGFWRTLAGLGFIAFHAGLAMTLTIGPYPFVCMAAWLLVLPAAFWDRLSRLGTGDTFRRLAVRHLPRLRRLAPRSVGPARSGEPGLIATLASVLVLVYMLSANMLTAHVMSERYYNTFFGYLEPTGEALRIIQRWNMFSPAPPTRDGWYVVEGRYASGATRDLFRDAELTWERPDDIAATYKNERWRKYLEAVMDKPSVLGPEAAAYFRRHGANTTGDEPESVRLYLMGEATRADFTSSPVAAYLLAEYPPDADLVKAIMK
ncbi:MAG: HTTM domain-containing protein [Rhodothermales bacterium]|nr:HTTM domain-containing protein [Rhodothermales bacterium]